MKSTVYILFALMVLFSSFTKMENKGIIPSKTEKQPDRDSIVSYAKKYMGTPYLYAGNDPKKGFDCSGFVNFVFRHFDVNLPRSSGEYKNIGKTLSPKDFRVGDILVFYGYKDKTIIGHLGIICEANGMDSKFIHASSGKAGSVTISELNSDHYSKRYYKCINVLSK